MTQGQKNAAERELVTSEVMGKLIVELMKLGEHMIGIGITPEGNYLTLSCDNISVTGRRNDVLNLARELYLKVKQSKTKSGA